jgi:hypothetical protein
MVPCVNVSFAVPVAVAVRAHPHLRGDRPSRESSHRPLLDGASPAQSSTLPRCPMPVAGQVLHLCDDVRREEVLDLLHDILLDKQIQGGRSILGPERPREGRSRGEKSLQRGGSGDGRKL